MDKYTIRCDGGKYGMGHVMRCLDLAHALDERGVAVEFCSDEPVQEWDWVAPGHIKLDTDTLVWDCPHESFEQYKGKCRIVTIDDPLRRDADKRFYPPTASALRLKDAYVGWEWVIVPSVFDRAERPRNHKPVVAMVYGGHVLPLFNALFGIANLVLLRNLQQADLAHIVKRADIVVANMGVVAYELACAGVPAVLYCTTPDHFESAQCLVDLGAVEAYDNPVDIPAAVQQLLLQPEVLHAMHEAGTVLDTHGAGRIADELTRDSLKPAIHHNTHPYSKETLNG